MRSVYYTEQLPRGGKWVVYESASFLKGPLEVCQTEYRYQAELIATALTAYQDRTLQLIGKGDK